MEIVLLGGVIAVAQSLVSAEYPGRASRGPLAGSADLAVTQTASPDPVAAGQRLTFAISVFNNGPSVATGVKVLDQLPAGASLVSASARGGCTTTASLVTCILGTTATSTVETVQIVVTAPPTAGTISNLVSVQGNEADPISSNSSSTRNVTVTAAVDLSVSISAAPNPVGRNQSLTYQITVQNGGPSAATGVVVTDVLPTGTSLVSQTATQGSCSSTSGTVLCSLGSLVKDASAKATVVVRPTVPGSLTNSASVRANEADVNPANDSASVTVAVLSCVPPAAPTFVSAPVSAVSAGNGFTLAWTPTVATDPLGTYQVDLSTSGCSSFALRYPTNQTSITIPTSSGQESTYCCVVRALTGDNCPSDDSPPVTIHVETPPASFVLAQPQWPPGISVLNSPPPADSKIVFRNIGGKAATLNLSSLLGFVKPEPDSLPDVPPGESREVRLTFDPFATIGTGVRFDSIRGTWTPQPGGATATIAAAVTLTVLDSPASPGASQGSRLQPRDSTDAEVHFFGPVPRPVTIVNTGDVPVRVAPTIGPGGTWLQIQSGDFSSPMQPGEARTFVLGIDRTRRTTADGAPPITTNLTFNAVDGARTDAVIVQVFDEEPPPATSGMDRPSLEAGSSSLIFGSSVGQFGLGGTLYVSDGWIHNTGSDLTTADLYYVPDGKDGLTDPSVRKATLSLAPYSTYRLADFVRGLFTTQGSGHVEIRSRDIAQLLARSTVDTLLQKSAGIARYGAEIPTIRSGQGASLTNSGGAPLILPGLSGGGSSASYTNLILSETSGRSVEVLLRLRAADGTVLREYRTSLPPYSKAQINHGDSQRPLFPSDVSYDGSSVEVVPVGGTGTVAAFATVLDRASRGYTTRTGRFAAEALAAARRPLGSAAPATVPPSRFVLPAVAHVSGANSSFFTTDLSMTNGTASTATLFLTYWPRAASPGDPRPAAVGPKSVTIGAKKTVTITDLLATLFGFSSNTDGLVVLEGDVAKVVASSTTSTPLDLADASKGVSPATLAVYAPESGEAVGSLGSRARSVVIAHPSAEESGRFRSNLILAEVAGKSAVVRVRLVPSNSQGVAIAEETYNLGAFEKRQINRVLTSLTQADPSVASFVDVQVMVEGLAGEGRVVAVISKIDNDPSSKRTDFYVLGPTGAAQGSIGF